MKIVHISYWENQGGAAIAANRLHKAMLKNGMDSNMLVVERDSNSKHVFSINTSWNKILLLFYSILSSRLLSPYRPYLGNFSINGWGIDITKYEIVKKSDIIYLHWINNSMVSLSSIKKLLKQGKIIVWFLHDMYPLTGGCHHSFNCDKFQNYCGNCTLLKSNMKYDISYLQLRHKKRMLNNNSRLSIVAPSHWLAKCAYNSSLFHLNKITVIPNLIDIKDFKIISRDLARNILGLPHKGQLILFGADKGVENPYKGWKYLRDALSLMGEGCSLVTFGDSYDLEEIGLSMPVYNMGKLRDVYSLNLLYSACNVFVIPSLAEAFGQTALEATMAGIPVVGFDIGGIPDVIHHKQNGFLAKYKDSTSLKQGIDWCLNIESDDFALKCRAISESNFSAFEVIKLHKKMILDLQDERI